MSLEVKGYGEVNPMASDHTISERKPNHRVDIRMHFL